MRQTCAACGKQFKQPEQYAYLSGDFYCSRACYATLFTDCIHCGQTTMLTDGEPECHDCYLKTRGLTVVRLSFGPFDGHF
jgi:DNA-directed RNA polymerase subunit RPC12/RpoP